MTREASGAAQGLRESGSANSASVFGGGLDCHVLSASKRQLLRMQIARGDCLRRVVKDPWHSTLTSS